MAATTKKVVLALEIGASRLQVTYKLDNEPWQPLLWKTAVHSYGEMKSLRLPAIVAVRKDSPYEFYGYEALEQCQHITPGLVVFQHLKSHMMSSDHYLTAGLRSAAEKDARELGLDCKHLAMRFFTYVLEQGRKQILEQTSRRIDILQEVELLIYLNVVDAWPNIVSQELLENFRKIAPTAQIRCIDECFCGVHGIIEEVNSQVNQFVVVDCGHSTTNIGYAERRDEASKFQVVEFVTLPRGASDINFAAEGAVNLILEHRNEAQRELGANLSYEINDFIDREIKANVDVRQMPFNVTPREWLLIMQSVRSADRLLNEGRLESICPVLQNIQGPVALIVTGQASRSGTFRKAMESLKSKYPNVEIVDGLKGEQTAVLKGLQRIHEDPGLIETQYVTTSLWLRSDPPDKTRQEASEDPCYVFRICEKGRPLEGLSGFANPIHYELESASAVNATIDLSVWGTPANLHDNDVKTAGNEGERVCTYSDKLDKFGNFSYDTGHRSETKFHVYLYLRMTKMDITLFLAHAIDGHEIENPGSIEHQIGKPPEGWTTQEQSGLKFVVFGQIVRPPLSGLSARKPEERSKGKLPTINKNARRKRGGPSRR